MTIRLITIGALLLTLGAVPVAAQTSITSTTLAAAVTDPAPTAKNISVTSATGMVANGILYIDGAVYQILSVNGTTIRVINQERPATHLTSAVVYVVPVAAQIGLNPVGSCIRGSGQVPQYSPYTLMFNLSTGDIASCRGGLGSRAWVITNPYQVQLSSNPPQTP